MNRHEPDYLAQSERNRILNDGLTYDNSALLANIARKNRVDLSALVPSSEYVSLYLSDLKTLTESIGLLIIPDWDDISYDAEKLQTAPEYTLSTLLSQIELPVFIFYDTEILPEHAELMRYVKIDIFNTPGKSLIEKLKEWEERFTQLPYLEYIYIKYPNFYKDPSLSSTLYSWSKQLGLTIRGLDLGHSDYNKLDDFDVSEIHNLSSSTNKISPEALMKLLNNNDLRTLFIRLNPNSCKALVDAIPKLPLQSLNIESNDKPLLNDSLCKKLSESSTLEHISIRYHYISPQGVEYLLRIPSLKNLILSDSASYSFSDEEISALKAVRPDLNVFISNHLNLPLLFDSPFLSGVRHQLRQLLLGRRRFSW